MLNKKMLLSVLIIGTVAAVAGAGTWAQFYDIEMSKNNTFTAGTLDLKIDGYDDNDAEFMAVIPFEFSSVSPGDSDYGEYNISNAGNMAGNLNINVTITEDSDNVDTEPESGVDTTPDDGELDSWTTVTITNLDNNVELFNGTLRQLSNLNGINYGTLSGGDHVKLKVAYEIEETDTDADNTIQGDFVKFDLVLTLTQN